MERSQSYTHFNDEQQHHLKDIQQKSMSGQSLNNIIPNTPLTLRRKRKLLQRQQSREYADDDMDYEYAADHEDADADEEDEDLSIEKDLAKDIKANVGSLDTQKPNNSILRKNLQLQRRKPQSSNALLINALSSNINNTQIMATAVATTCTTTFSYVNRRSQLKHEESFDSSSSAGVMSLGSPVSPSCCNFGVLKRDNSLHSDSSRYSSVDSLLEARKPDPEAILINLGFGPVGSEDILSRIPKRFLKPSKVRGNDTEAFVRRLQLANTLADQSVLGYRGLTGNPDLPPSSIVAKIMHRFEVNERKKSLEVYNTSPEHSRQ